MIIQSIPQGTLIDPTHPLARGLTCWLRMSDRAGSRAYDSSGKGNHGTLTDFDTTRAWTGSTYGGGVKMDGTDDFINIPHNVSMNATSQISICMRMNPTAITAAYSNQLTMKGTATTDSNWNVYYWGVVGDDALEEGRTALYANIAGTFQKITPHSSVIPLAKWTHVAFTYNGSFGATYVNGALEGTFAVSGTLTTNAQPTLVGKALGGFTGGSLTFLNGSLDDVRFYNRALSPAEVSLTASGVMPLISRRRLLAA